MMDEIVAEGIRDQAFPGAVLYIQHKDSVLVHKAYGFFTYDSLRPTQNNDIFDLASVTKVTAATLALMKLYEDGLIDLDDPVRKYVSGFGHNKRGKATIRETLAHQAGWEPWIPYYKDMMEADGTYKKKFFRADSSAAFPIRLRDGLYLTSGYYAYIKKQIKHSNFDPERGFIYSGLFFYMVPEIVETLTGKKMDVYLEETFYGPLGAATVGFNPMNRYPVERIVPTEIDDYFRNFAIHGVVHDEGAALMDGVSGNAGLFANAADLAKVWAMFMNNGQMDSLTFLSPSTLDLFTTVQFPNENNHRGLGFNKPFLVYNEKSSPVAKAAGFRSFGHTGYTGPLVWVDPDTDLLFIFLCNRVYPTRNQTRIYELNIRPRLHALSYELIR